MGDLVPVGKRVSGLIVPNASTTTEFALGCSFTRGVHYFVERIEPFEVHGEMAMVPWFRVIDSHKGEVFAAPASLCAVFYKDAEVDRG